MRRLYYFIIDHGKVIATIMLLLIIPDLIFHGWFLFAHFIVVCALMVIVLIGCIIELNDEDDYDDMPCRFCAPIKELPSTDRYSGFAIHDGSIWFSDSTEGWLGTGILYCPMCGRELEDYDV